MTPSLCVRHEIVFNLRSCRMQTIDMVEREKKVSDKLLILATLKARTKFSQMF